MIIRPVNALQGGEILSKRIVTEKKEILIYEGMEIKKEYVSLLKFLGIDYVYIEDPYAQYEIPHYIIPLEKWNSYVNQTRDILENHIYSKPIPIEKIEKLAKEIITDIPDMNTNCVFDFNENLGNLYEHTISVTVLVLMIARKMKLSEECLLDISRGCLLHDLGIRYITVPYMDSKVEDGTAAEIFEYKKHTILAYTALESEINISPLVKDMVLSHHERKDGSGFPLKQRTKGIECEILQACDCFDGFIRGVEHKQKSIQEALEILSQGKDTSFDGKVISAMEATIAKYPVGTVVLLNTNEKGIVVEQTEQADMPEIRIIDEKNQITDKVYNLSTKKERWISSIIV